MRAQGGYWADLYADRSHRPQPARSRPEQGVRLLGHGQLLNRLTKPVAEAAWAAELTGTPG